MRSERPNILAKLLPLWSNFENRLRTCNVLSSYIWRDACYVLRYVFMTNIIKPCSLNLTHATVEQRVTSHEASNTSVWGIVSLNVDFKHLFIAKKFNIVLYKVFNYGKLYNGVLFISNERTPSAIYDSRCDGILIGRPRVGRLNRTSLWILRLSCRWWIHPLAECKKYAMYLHSLGSC